MTSLSFAQTFREIRSQSSDIGRRKLAEKAVPMSRDMLCDNGLRPEYVVIEHCSPRLARGGRQRSKIQHSVNQSVKGRVGSGRCTARGVPPVVDQQVERLQRLDVVPP